MELHIRMGQLMEQHGFTNQSMADASGVPVGTVSGIRSGKIRSPSYDSVRAMLAAMGEPASALGDAQRQDGRSPEGFTGQQQTIMDQSCRIASLSAALDAHNASAERSADRHAKLEAELEQERKKNARLQTWLMVMMVAVVVLMVVYLWDVSNLHSGLTAYFNQ